jgi:hypothetical protein
MISRLAHKQMGRDEILPLQNSILAKMLFRRGTRLDWRWVMCEHKMRPTNPNQPLE